MKVEDYWKERLELERKKMRFWKRIEITKCIMLLIFFSLLFLAIYSPCPAHVKGFELDKKVEDQHGNPLEGATVILYTHPNGMVVAQGETDEYGWRNFTNIQYGRYFLWVSYGGIVSSEWVWICDDKVITNTLTLPTEGHGHEKLIKVDFPENAQLTIGAWWEWGKGTYFNFSITNIGDRNISWKDLKLTAFINDTFLLNTSHRVEQILGIWVMYRTEHYGIYNVALYDYGHPRYFRHIEKDMLYAGDTVNLTVHLEEHKRGYEREFSKLEGVIGNNYIVIDDVYYKFEIIVKGD